MRRTLTLSALMIAAGVAALAPFAAATLGARQTANATVYAIRNARIVTGAGAPIASGTLVLRDGLIAEVGAGVTAPADAVVIDGTGTTVYPGLIDMGNMAAVDAGTPAGGRAGGAPAAGGGGRNGGANGTWADSDRAKREALLNPDFEASRHLRTDGVEMQRYAEAGITSVLAVPSTGVLRGQSALANTVAAPEPMQVSAVGAYRGGLTVIAAPVAQHVNVASVGGGGGYPVSLLGGIAFARQAFADAQWQKDARAWAARHGDQPRPVYDPALDALVPALEGKQPVAFDAGELREILRALALAKEFGLKPIIHGGIEAGEVAADLKAANAAVILTLNAGAGGGGGRGGGRGGAGDVPARVQRMQQNATKNAAALDKAGVPFAFSAAGLASPAEFIRGVARAVKDGGLPADQALKALTINAAKLAGADARLGTLERGKIANLIVASGDLFADGTDIRRVFIDGRPVK